MICLAFGIHRELRIGDWACSIAFDSFSSQNMNKNSQKTGMECRVYSWVTIKVTDVEGVLCRVSSEPSPRQAEVLPVATGEKADPATSRHASGICLSILFAFTPHLLSPYLTHPYYTLTPS